MPGRDARQQPHCRERPGRFWPPTLGSPPSVLRRLNASNNLVDRVSSGPNVVHSNPTQTPLKVMTRSCERCASWCLPCVLLFRSEVQESLPDDPVQLARAGSARRLTKQAMTQTYWRASSKRLEDAAFSHAWLSPTVASSASSNRSRFLWQSRLEHRSVAVSTSPGILRHSSHFY